VRGVIFGQFPPCTPDEGITNKSYPRDHISKARRLKSPQNIHKKHTHHNIIEELCWDYTNVYSPYCIVRPRIDFNGLLFFSTSS
jgi:hypothetical protein